MQQEDNDDIIMCVVFLRMYFRILCCVVILSRESSFKSLYLKTRALSPLVYLFSSIFSVDDYERPKSAVLNVQFPRSLRKSLEGIRRHLLGVPLFARIR